MPTYLIDTSTPSPLLSAFRSNVSPPIDLWECIWWWVGECTAWWPKFTRHFSVENLVQNEERNWRLCAVLIIMALPNHVPRQLQYSQPSVTLLLYIRQNGWLQETNIHGMPGQSIHPPAWVPVRNCKTLPYSMNCCVSVLNMTHVKPLCLFRKSVL